MPFIEVQGPNGIELIETDGKLYPIEEKVDDINEILYDRKIQRVAYIQANIVAIFTDWFKSFFAPEYFKFTRLRTESVYSEFKSFMKNIYKKEKPFLVIDPKSPEVSEDSLFGLNMLNRYNPLDPSNDMFGAKLMYALPIMTSELFELQFRRNRYKFDFDIMIMEKTLDRQINLYNNMIMNIRHNSKFTLERIVLNPIPETIIENIARFHKYNYKSDEFLSFLNKISQYPIIRRILPNGLYMFFMQQNVHLYVEVPSFPSKDSPETSDAIEWGARITDNFVITADLPSEFIFLTPKDEAGAYEQGIDDEYDIYYIPPYFVEPERAAIIGDFTRTTQLDVMMATGESNELDIIPIVHEFNDEMGRIAEYCILNNMPISTLFMVKSFINASTVEASTSLSEKGILTILDPQYDKLYNINLYINFKQMNLIRENLNKTYIGTVEKY